MHASPRPSDRRTALLLACLLLVSASGCFGTGDGTADPQAQRVQEDSLSAMANVSSYEAELSMTIDTGDGSLEAEITGAVNETSRRMSFDVSMAVPSRGSRETTAYVVNQTQYQQRGDTWVSTDVSDREIWERDRLEQQKRLLRNATVTLEGNRTIDGVRTYVVRSSPDKTAVREMLGNSPSGSASLGDVTIEAFTLTHYIGHSSHHLRKVQLEMTITQDGQSADMTMTMTFRRHDESVTVDLPAAIADGSAGPTPVDS